MNELNELYLTKLSTSITMKFESGESNVFSPDFTHQFFGPQESIFGYKNLSIILSFTPSASYCLFELKHDGSLQLQQTQALGTPDIRGKIAPYFPKDCFLTTKRRFTEQVNNEKNKNTFEIPGKIVKRFQLGKQTFVITMGTFQDPDFVMYFERIQHFILWFCDGSSTLDVTDTNWRVWIIFEENQDQEKKESKNENENEKDLYFTFVGFSYAYLFTLPNNDIFKQKQINMQEILQSRLRISNFLILPAFRDIGISAYLLRSIYEYSFNSHQIDSKKKEKEIEKEKEMEKSKENEKRKEKKFNDNSFAISQITTEDPNETLQNVRSAFDLWNYSSLKIKPNHYLTQNQVSEICKKIKICFRQFRICYECSCLLESEYNYSRNFEQLTKTLIQDRLKNEFDDLLIDNLETRIENEFQKNKKIISTMKSIFNTQQNWKPLLSIVNKSSNNSKNSKNINKNQMQIELNYRKN
ncbi:histone acetyltransferase type b catalytic subunit [Anaeramoeba flamelloides]|uniref:histone acetyltransferase n=1 Tax=Anaeramoeba flamelloides TaxID=1746091 RepID=A0ABQ8ZFE6_9EUKA|nr:histone acetyltransferase type b catalytic subunit [Anaeramoeba flamelloides]